VAQVLKAEVRERIGDAALEVFARKGFAPATMAEIAKAAHVATGNVYLYFPNKEELFHAVLPDTFVDTLTRLLRRRVEALSGIADVGLLPEDAPYHEAAGELLRFCIEHRLRVVVLLSRAAGTRHASFTEETVERLVKLAVAHARSVGAAPAVTRSLRFALTRIYGSFVATMAAALAELEDEADIRAVVAHVTDYHLAGLKALFEGARPPTRGRKEARS
jgi:AcrR family transcriptional regulator